MNSLDYSLEEFLAYVLIYAANADFVITAEEEAYIKNLAGEAAYNKMLSLFQSHNDAEVADFIITMKQTYLPIDQPNALLKLVKEVFDLDHDLDAEEKAVYYALKHIV